MVSEFWTPDLTKRPTPQGMDPRAPPCLSMCGARPRLQFEGSYFSVGLIVWELCLFQVFNNMLDPMCERVYIYTMKRTFVIINRKNICTHHAHGLGTDTWDSQASAPHGDAIQ